MQTIDRMRAGSLPLLFLALLFMLSAAVSGQAALKVGAYQNEPYCMVDSTGLASGICVEVLEEIARIEEWELEFVPARWEDCLGNVSRGEIDILVCVAWAHHREGQIEYSKETLLRTWGQVFAPGGSGIGSLLDIEGLRVAVMKGDIYADVLKRNMARYGIEAVILELEDYRAVLDAVEGGQADAGVVDKLFGRIYGKAYGVRPTDVVFSPIEVRFAFPPGKGGERIATIDRHVRRMNRDPESVLHRSIKAHLMKKEERFTPGWKMFHFLIRVFFILLAILIIYLIFRVRKRGSELTEKEGWLRKEQESRKEAEELLDITRERQKKLFDLSPSGIAILRMDGTIIEMNRAAEKLLGLERGEGEGKGPHEIPALSSSLSLIEEKLAGIKEKKEFEPFEITAEVSGSEPRHVILHYFLAPDPREGEVIFVIGTDVTERSIMEEQIRQMQKMEAVGTLAGGVAHDFNNLLTGILGYANILKIDYHDDEVVSKSAGLIEHSAERASRLTSQLLAFARKGKHQVEKVDMHRVIVSVMSILERTIEKDIRIRTRFEADSHRVSGDPDQIEQVVLNLALNSREAMPGGGDLTIKTETVEIDEIYCETHPDAEPGRYLRMAVDDTGRGIPEGIRKRIFEPFFSTKIKSEGTGMGLAMVYGIVRNHGGSVELYSEDGLGTSVKIYLPLIEEKEDGLRREETIPVKGQGRIIAIDDEEIVLKTASAMLTRLGYEVETFRDCQKAIDHYSENREQIDLVVLDMIMPVMDGGDVFRALRRIDPTVKVLLSSGYILDERARELLEEGIDGFIQKPFLLSQLSTKILEILKP